MDSKHDKMKDVTFHATTPEAAATLLNSDIEKGLTSLKAKEVLAAVGPNSIEKAKEISAWQLAANQFKSPIVYLLLFAVAMSFWFKEWLDGAAILLVIFVNAAIGFYMEYKAQKSVQELQKLSLIQAKVVRDGKLKEINTEEIVPGDLLFAEAGDMIPADGLLVKATQLQIDESALTGESVPVEKQVSALPEATVLGDRTNMAFKATAVSKGNGYILVCATGMHTELGKIANLVHTSKPTATPLEKKLEEFSKKLIKITLGLVVVIFGAGLINGVPVLEMVQTAIALAVAAIPEGLPIVATMTLAQGMLKMSRYKVIVKKLAAVETLGGTNVICTDKTGTLTQNKMEVVFVEMASGTWKKEEEFTANADQLELLTKAVVLCNTAELHLKGKKEKEIGDPLEIALLRFATGKGDDVAKIRKDFVKKDEEPFSSETKIMATHHTKGHSHFVFAKGAPEEVLGKCTGVLEEGEESMSTAKQKKWLAAAEKFSASGHRMIAVAYRKTSGKPASLTEDLVFLGLVGMIDPPRPEVFAAINECKTAGIKVVMITGDHPATAQFIGNQLGISTEEDVPVVGKDMKEFEALTGKEKQGWRETSVFARVSPKNKLDLVRVFQEKKYVVGMTGDGVNDAPAIKQSDIGIAMGLRGTQVAQEVSDMVLKDDSFSSIVLAIKQGRIIFENIRKFVTFLLSCNLSELVVIAVAAIGNASFQLIPLQILFINLITDLLPALALGITKGGDNIMALPPRKSSEPILDKSRWKLIFFYSFVIAMATTGAVLVHRYFFYNGESANDAMGNNILFFTLIVCQLMHVLNMGTGPFFKNEVIRNAYIWYAIAASLAILFGVIQISIVKEALHIVPMTLMEWVIILSAAFTSVLVIQVAKAFGLFIPRQPAVPGKTKSGSKGH